MDGSFGGKVAFESLLAWRFDGICHVSYNVNGNFIGFMSAINKRVEFNACVCFRLIMRTSDVVIINFEFLCGFPFR